jgi:hypothetical protein
MRRTLVLLLVTIVVCLAVAGVFAPMLIDRGYQRAGETSWAAGLGPLTAAPARFPAAKTNAAAARFAELASALEPPEAVAEYLRAELERGDDTIAPPPPAVEAYLQEHDAALTAIRDHLLASGDLVWQHNPAAGLDAKAPNLPAQLRSARLLVLRALGRGDWDELRAASRLVPPLLARPEVTSVALGTSILRQVLAAAWKLPSPAPEWFRELDGLEPEESLARATQYESWLMWANIASSIWMRLALADFVRHQRETLAPLVRSENCPSNVRDYFRRRAEKIARWNSLAQAIVPDYGSLWSRAFRYRAEREATMNASRAAGGQPIVPRSRCGGTWGSETLPDGRIRVSYSHAIPKAGEKDLDIPLTRTTRVRTRPRST